jgi:hypothetical protein
MLGTVCQITGPANAASGQNIYVDTSDPCHNKDGVPTRHASSSGMLRLSKRTGRTSDELPQGSFSGATCPTERRASWKRSWKSLCSVKTIRAAIGNQIPLSPWSRASSTTRLRKDAFWYPPTFFAGVCQQLFAPTASSPCRQAVFL